MKPFVKTDEAYLKAIYQEIKNMETLTGGPNISNLIDIITDPESDALTLIVEMVEVDYSFIPNY